MLYIIDQPPRYAENSYMFWQSRCGVVVEFQTPH